MMETRSVGRWRFDRRVSIEGLIQMGIVIIAVLGGALKIIDEVKATNAATAAEFRAANAQMDKRVAILEAASATQARIDSSQDSTTRDGLRSITTQLNQIQSILLERGVR